MPMMRRRPVIRTVGRTAVIAGTATAVAGGVSRHQQNKYAQQDAAAQRSRRPPLRRWRRHRRPPRTPTS